MGEKIELKGYQGYAAGLDTKSKDFVILVFWHNEKVYSHIFNLAGESGSISYRSSWNGTDIMFHVAPLMPLQNNDKQHIFRKKHIGNGNFFKKE
jgi:hypothetical protein